MNRTRKHKSKRNVILNTGKTKCPKCGAMIGYPHCLVCYTDEQRKTLETSIKGVCY